MKPSVPALALVSLFVLALGTPAFADAPKPRARKADETALRKLVADQADAWNRHDAKAWCRDFADDAEFINITGAVLTGKPEIEKRHAFIFANLFHESKTVVTVRRVAFVGPNVAIVDMDHEVTGYATLPPGVQPTSPGLLRTRMKFVLEKRGGAWRILAGQNTDVKPAPQPPPGAAPTPK